MSVTYRVYHGKRLSREWDIVLRAADRAGVRFTVTSGHRTFGQQAALYSAYRAGRGNLAAVPSHNAPHIRTGRIDHAVDVNALDGGARRLADWLKRQGGVVSFPVPGEPWHLEMPASSLRKLAAKLGLPPLTRAEKEHAANLLARRRTARRHGGWRKVAALHNRSATRSKRWIAERIRYLRELRNPNARQRARLRYLRDVYHGRLT
ncbi:MAG: hypothetical protein M0P31_13765 [Solirubrobacteraceae bacterium]|nr:hypothetical protein [Solirubrobacteraceae bacterium]